MVKRFSSWVCVPALVGVALLSGCASAVPTTTPPPAGNLPCAKDPSCTVYSSSRAAGRPALAAVIAATPIKADYYRNPGMQRFVVVAGCNAITLPIAQAGAKLTIDLAHVAETLCGYAGDSPGAREEGLVDQVLLSRSVTATIDTTTNVITFSAGTESITFVPA
jgi:hypothetical protein